MAETSAITAEKRSDFGSRAAKRLRAQGRIPAVMYGHKEETVALSLDAEQIGNLVRHGAHGLLDVEVEGKKESAVIKDMQWDVFGREILHVDFNRVSRDEKVTLEVPIVTRGTAPGVAEGGVVEHLLHTIEIECPASDIQQSVVVNINHLHLNETVLVKDLVLNPGTRALSDAEQIVVQVVIPTVVEEPEEGLASASEPEVIRREGAKTEEGEE